MNFVRTAILLAGLTALFIGVGYLIGGQTGAMIALLVAAAMNLFGYWNSDRMVLSMVGAREVDAGAAPDLYRLVRELSQRAGLPMPRVFIIPSEQPNAFATGRSPKKAAVAVTEGLLRYLPAPAALARSSAALYELLGDVVRRALAALRLRTQEA